MYWLLVEKNSTVAQPINGAFLAPSPNRYQEKTVILLWRGTCFAIFNDWYFSWKLFPKYKGHKNYFIKLHSKHDK